MSIFDSCTNTLFPMKCDVYYAEESQDDYGQIQKNWSFYSTYSCAFYPEKAKNRDGFSFEDQRFYNLEQTLFGRIKTDIRKNSYGEYYPMSHILITNIRQSACNDEVLFYETLEGYEGTPTIYEVRMVQPHIGPFSTPEYYSIELKRSDTQELNPSGIC